MTRIIVVVFATTFVGTSVACTDAAWATLYEVTDKVGNVDPVHHYIRLRNGEYYRVPDEMDLSGIKVGDEVTLTVHVYHDDVNRVEAITRIGADRREPIRIDFPADREA